MVSLVLLEELALLDRLDLQVAQVFKDLKDL
jgi:hypothetical protein